MDLQACKVLQKIIHARLWWTVITHEDIKWVRIIIRGYLSGYMWSVELWNLRQESEFLVIVTFNERFVQFQAYVLGTYLSVTG